MFSKGKNNQMSDNNSADIFNKLAKNLAVNPALVSAIMNYEDIGFAKEELADLARKLLLVSVAFSSASCEQQRVIYQYRNMLFSSKSEQDFINKYKQHIQSLGLEHLFEESKPDVKPCDNYGQCDLFASLDNDCVVTADTNNSTDKNLEPAPDEKQDSDKTTSKKSSKTRAKRKAKEFSLEQLKALGYPVEEIILNTIGDTTCSACGHQLEVLGTKVVTARLERTNPEYKIKVYLKASYVCPNKECTDKGVPQIVKTEAAPLPLLSHSLISASLASYLICAKYAGGAPFYRQGSLEIFTDNLPISHKLINKWSIKLFDLHLAPFYELLLKELLKQEVIHADETRLRCVNSSHKDKENNNASTSWLWVTCSSPYAQNKIHYVMYSDSRKKDNATKLFGNYQGAVVSDCYSGYADLTSCGIIQGGCYAHLRRRLTDYLRSIVGILKDYTQQAHYSDTVNMSIQLVKLINNLFSIEDKCSTLSADERLAIRKQESKPIVDCLFSTCHKINDTWIITSKKFKEFITYAVKNENVFRAFLEHGGISLTNNVAESAIRPIAVGRKNFLFCNNHHGGQVLAGYYSIIRTAQANGLNPQKYLEYIFDRITNPKYRNTPELLKEFLPWNNDVQKHCLSLKNTSVQLSKVA